MYNKIQTVLMVTTQANRGSSSVHLQCPDGSHQHHHVGSQARVAALDVEELLHANVGAKTGLCHWSRESKSSGIS